MDLTEQIKKINSVVDNFHIDVDINEIVDKEAVTFYESRMQQCRADGVPQAIIAYVNHALANDNLNALTKLYITQAFVEATT